MQNWMKYALVTVIVGAVAFFLGPKIWPPSSELVPTAGQLPFFILLSAIEALLLGFGVAFMIFNWMPKSAAFWALSWFLVSWWPHDNWHINNGLEPAGLLMIEYGFHVTLIIAAIVLARDWMSRKA